MHTSRERDETALPRGSLLRLSETREVAIYLRDGVTWVADFRDGYGELFTVGEWFALNHCGGVLRRMKLDPIAPLPDRVAERIEQLHCAEKSADAPTLMAALVGVAARLRDEFAGCFRTPPGGRLAKPLGPSTQRN